MALAKGRLYTLGNASDKDTVWCLDAVTGKKLWSHSYDSPLDEKQFEGGPTSTPAVDEDRVYTLSRWGDVFCFEAATGKIVWTKNVQKESGVRVPGWGFASSPVIHEHMLLLNIGEAGMARRQADRKNPLVVARQGRRLFVPRRLQARRGLVCDL